MRKILIVICCLSLINALPQISQAQVLKNLKEKVNLRKGGKKILDNVLGEEEEDSDSSTSGTMGSSSGERKGKYLTPPDVNDNLAEAEAFATDGDYSGARMLIQQAIVGIEMEMGRMILNSFPKEINGLAYVEANDELYSSGMNFAGMGIGRSYGDNDKSLNVGVINNSILLSSYSAMMSASTYSAENEEVQAKTIRVQGNRGVIQYEESNDMYELGVPLGQSTIFILKGIRFSSEEEMMGAANAFDLTQIKDMLGEQ